MSPHANLENLIKTHRRRLQKLAERHAIEGVSTDPSVLIEIEDIEATIQELQLELSRSVDAPGRIPPPPPPSRRFTGRDELLAQLKVALTAELPPIVALQGMGGVGKTALAQKLAEDLRSHFTGGIFWADLPTNNGSAVVILQNWSHLLGLALTQQDRPSMAQTMRGLLENHQIKVGPALMIIDDVRAEWLSEAQLLRQALPTRMPLLLTTREEDLARVLGGQVYHHVDPLDHKQAMALLQKHAGDALLEAEPTAAKQLLDLLGYLPLAIKLAGQWLVKYSRKYRQTPIARLIKAIQEQGVKSLSLPDMPELAATFALTYEALHGDLRRCFRRLGVFAAGSVRLPSVAGVLGTSLSQTEQYLDELVNLALLDWAELTPDDIFVYSVHPLLKQYAHALLSEVDELETVQYDYLNYYLHLAQENSDNTVEAHDRLEAELVELLYAAELAAQKTEHQITSDFGLALWEQGEFLFVRGHYHAALEVLSRAAAASRILGDEATETIHLKNIGKVYDGLGQYDEAENFYLKSLAYFQKNEGNKLQLCDVREYLAALYVIRQQLDQATELIIQNLATAKEIDVEISQQKIEAQAHYALSNIAISRQNFAAAKTEVERSLALFEALGDAQRRAGAYYNLGVILAREGQDLAAAQTYFQKCLAYWQETGNLTAQTYTLFQLAMLERDQGEFTFALSYLDQAEAICLKINDAAGQATVRLQRGLTYLAAQEPDRACLEWQVGRQLAPEHLQQNFLSLLDQHCVEKKSAA